VQPRHCPRNGKESQANLQLLSATPLCTAREGDSSLILSPETGPVRKVHTPSRADFYC